MECTGEDEVVVRAQLVEPVLREGAVVDEAAGLVDDDEGVDGPVVISRSPENGD